jgi:hypothetical protein
MMPQSTRSIKSLLRIVVPALLVCSFFGAAHAQTYWFETYQRAVQLIDADKSAEAAPMLDQLVQNHPYPQASMRIPGHQYMDYLPYFQLARIQYDQKDFELASRSLDMSEAFGAVKHNKRSSAHFTQLRTRLDSELAGTDEKPTMAAGAR